jgi:disulfide bond formation protein DsbB
MTDATLSAPPSLKTWLNARRWPLLALLASAAMLATAHTFQAFGYPPCELCLRQREVYWAVIAISLVALIAQRIAKHPNAATIFATVIGLAFVWGAIVAGFHAGVEWKFWPGPKTCTGGGTFKPGDLSAALGGPQIVVMCDEAAWRLLGLSMAGWNALISLGLGLLSFVAARRA